MNSCDNKSWLSQGIKAAVTQSLIAHLFAYALPVGSVVTTVIVGWLTEQPWYLIWIASVVTFGFASIGLMNFYNIMDRNRVEDKLLFTNVVVGKPLSRTGLCPGVNMHNSSDVFIEYKIEEARTQIGNFAPTNRTFAVDTFKIPPKGNGFFVDHEINYTPPAAEGHYPATISFDISYGRPGQRKYKIKISKVGAISFGSSGTVISNCWNDTI